MPATGLEPRFAQNNHSRSKKNSLRGLHYQIQWAGTVLSAENKHMVWIPEGFGHGFLVLSDFADFLYQTTDYYAPEHERCVIWNDPEVGIQWPLTGESALSPKNLAGKRLRATDSFA